MLLLNTKKNVRKLPQKTKNFFYDLYSLIPIDLRLGKTFRETYRFLNESEYWGEKKFESYQVKKIIELINYSYNNVEYYHELFNRIGIKPDKIKMFDDFKNIPFLEKDIIENNFSSLISSEIDKKRIGYARTGGTSGRPLKFCTEIGYSRPKELAFIYNLWRRVGFNYRHSKRIGMRGRIFKHQFISEYDARFKILYLSTFKMTDSYLNRYVQIIKEHKPDFIWTYPSAASMLANHVKDEKITGLPNLKAVLCSSEIIYPYQKELIENVFHTRMFSWYGHSEQLTLAGECECSHDYHVYPQYGYTELVGNNGEIIKEAGRTGEIVATGFNNYAMPLIRYKTGDYAEWADSEPCACGRSFPKIRNVKGRWVQEIFVGKDKNLISMTALNTHTDIFDEVKQFQFFQEEKGKVKLKLIRKKDYSSYSTQKIVDELQEKFGESIELKLEFVTQIKKTDRGKHKFLIQKLDIDGMMTKKG